ncbi:hypothetical protein GQ43DRAFT_377403 [Delitschia confertaspora ATCC 74209]|uniref:Uncharacterized protein n=1 Tax=Delitschia confertaspora ATCC 74209 TaxID=1513339 RepID=A0A9P4JKR7_9PLEO|nr:hypothetical protein GQ43DRAFT_377403 [Delitschia confertaspora ATCC 74209]
MSVNYSLFGVPVYWLYALAPHMYGVNIIKKARNGKWDNTNPRGGNAASDIQKSVPKDVFARYERCEGAHKNSMENAPFFMCAMLVGNVVGLPANTMNTAAAAYMGLRIAHTLLYINVTSQKYSYLRTLVYTISTIVLQRLFFQAAWKLAYDY